METKNITHIRALQQVKIRPLMDGNSRVFSRYMCGSPVKIRPLMDGNCFNGYAPCELTAQLKSDH